MNIEVVDGDELTGRGSSERNERIDPRESRVWF